MEENEIQLSFTDITLNETDGDYNKTKEIMDSEFPYNSNWVIRTDLSIVSNSGICLMEVQFHGNGDVYILNYSPSIGDVYYNSDISSISQWCQGNNWKIPQPSVDLIKSNKDFWKYFYDTSVIDSDYFEEHYGKRG